MKIEKKNNKEFFEALDVGEIFIYHNEPFIKTNGVTIDTSAVSLRTGRMTKFFDDTIVYIVNAVLTLK